MKNLSKLPQMKCMCIVVLLLTIGFTFSESISQCVTPPSGLVSWWPGDDNANDIQGSNHGTLQNGVTFTTGKVGQAFSFDGIDDNAEAPAISERSVDMWIKPNSQAQMGFYSGGIVLSNNQSYEIFIYQPNGLGGGSTFDNTFGLSLVFWNNDIAIPFDAIKSGWHHIAISWDGETQVRIGIDGQFPSGYVYDGLSVTWTPQTQPFTLPRVPNPDVTATTLIGKTRHTLWNIGSQYFNGFLDEGDVFDHALSESEIQAIFNAGSAGKCILPPTCVSAPSGLVSWWPGEGNADDIQDSNDGTLINGAAFTTGKVGQAFSFDGVDDYVKIPKSPNLDMSTGVTVEAWIKGDPSNPMNTCCQGIVGADHYLLGISNGGLYFVVGTTNGAVHAPGPGPTGPFYPTSTNVFHHVAGTYDGSSVNLYVDGQLVASNPHSGTILQMFASSFITIGSEDGRSGCAPCVGARYFKGLIDEVGIYNRAISASEIQAIYNAGSAGKCKECEPPTADAGDNQTICPNQSVQIGGDPTGSGGTGTLTFSWEPADGLSDANAANPTATPTSTTTYTVTVTDANGCSATDEVTVTVEDNEAPVITITTNPITLWPPNHQYVTINISQCVTAVTDNCATLSPNNVIITQVTSDEPEDAKGGGDGNTKNDMVIAANCQSVQLRSEREGSGNGRVYTIHLSVNDGNGNTSAATCLVTIPKSQNGNSAIDDGPVYTVSGSCSGSATKIAENTGDAAAQETLPAGYALFQNYPNPFNPATEITFALPEAGKVTLRIYSETGQLIRTLIDNEMQAGQRAVRWNGLNESGNTVAAGVYLYRLAVRRQNGETAFTETRRMTLLK